MRLPPFLVPGGDFALRVLRVRGEERWWWTPGAERELDACLAASTGRRAPAYALAARLGRLVRGPTTAAWAPGVAEFLGGADATARALVSQLGTPGHYRKHAARLLDEQGQTLAILKCSESPASAGSIRAEAAALAALADRLPAALPRPRAVGEIGGRTLALQTPVDGRRSTRWTEAHDELAAALFRAGQAGGGRWDDALAPRERVRDLLAACGGDAGRIAALCARLLETAAPQARGLPLGWTHRDFTAANVWSDGARLAVIDWEWADAAWAPGHDLIHFHLMDPLRRGDDAAAAAAALAADGSPLGRHARALGLDCGATPLLALYLYDTILFYAQANGEGMARAHAHPLIAAACELASRLLAQRPAAPARLAPSARVQTLRD